MQHGRRQAAQQLAALIATVAARSPSGFAPDRAADAARLIALVGADPDESAVDDFFHATAMELRARGATLPPLDQLPPAVAPLIVALGDAFHTAELDYEAVFYR